MGIHSTPKNNNAETAKKTNLATHFHSHESTTWSMRVGSNHSRGSFRDDGIIIITHLPQGPTPCIVVVVVVWVTMCTCRATIGQHAYSLDNDKAVRINVMVVVIVGIPDRFRDFGMIIVVVIIVVV